jgi:uncharacterized membrane protein
MHWGALRSRAIRLQSSCQLLPATDILGDVERDLSCVKVLNMVKERDESLDNERDTGRLEAFSDGVFAVAITLLVLNIQVPPVADGLITGLHNTSASYLGYVTSFLLIGLFWANHHYLFKYVKRTDHFLLLLNILVLMCVVLIPFATELLTAYIVSADRYNVAMLYCGTLLLTSIMYNLLWFYASSNYRLVDKDIAASTIQRMSRRYLISLPLYVLTILIGAINVEACLILNIVIAVVYALPATFFQLRRPKRVSREG